MLVYNIVCWRSLRARRQGVMFYLGKDILSIYLNHTYVLTALPCIEPCVSVAEISSVWFLFIPCAHVLLWQCPQVEDLIDVHGDQDSHSVPISLRKAGFICIINLRSHKNLFAQTLQGSTQFRNHFLKKLCIICILCV